MVNIIKICIWLLLLSYSAVLIQGAATGKENKVKLIKDNIVQPALAMIMRIKMIKLKIMMMMMAVV